MEIIHEKYGDNLNRLVVRDIKIYDEKSMGKLKSIIKLLAIGDEFYFEFVREDFFLDEEELIKHRIEVPHYLNQNGKYEVKFKLDETRFRSIGYLPKNEDTYNQIPTLWKYFEGVVFFNPSSTFNWEDFDRNFDRKGTEISTIDLINNKYTDSVFIKGHDGNNLIFIHSCDYDERLVNEVKDIIEK